MKKLSLWLALALTAVGSASAQLVSVGALGGVRLTEGVQFHPDESRIYTVGGSVEFALPASFAVEADALYERLGYSFALIDFLGFPAPGYSYRERVNAWEFPLLGKYYFRSPAALWRPFVGAGIAFRTGSIMTTVGDSHQDSRLDLEIGPVAAAGVRFKVGPMALLPQARYAYWGDNTRRLVRSEATLLLGASF